MAKNTDRRHERWANLRFAIVGALLAAPPAQGELRAALEALAARTWQHPITGAQVSFGNVSFSFCIVSPLWKEI